MGLLAAAGGRVAVAWFTGADKTPRVKLAFSNDAGETFGQPVAVDDGNPTGRVDVLLLIDGRAGLLARAARRWRRARAASEPDGRSDEAVTVAPSGTARSNGFPQMVRAGGELFFAWTGGRLRRACVTPKVEPKRNDMLRS